MAQAAGDSDTFGFHAQVTVVEQGNLAFRSPYAGVVNRISKEHQLYLADGGLGILIGDGRLPYPSTENILETHYDAALNRFLHLAIEYQFVDHPAYNADRGPVSIFAARLHAEF